MSRTSALGGHIDECDQCGYISISYNSCHNRHCPKCQTINKERWIAARKHDLLDVGYFHVVFTIPDTLNSIAYQNPSTVYKILFKAAAETLAELAADKKYLGAEIGITEVLHTCYSDFYVIPLLCYSDVFCMQSKKDESMIIPEIAFFRKSE
jgi:hypothetical protein